MFSPVAFWGEIDLVPVDPTPWFNTSWNYRTKISVDYTKVDATLTNFPIYLDLSLLPSGFHTNVSATAAQDIRITESDGVTELAREVVFYNASIDDGEVWFKGTTLSNTQNTDFYIYYGNNGASEPAATASNGRYNVWSSEYKYVGHLQSSAADSTSTQKASSVLGSPTYSTGNFGNSLEGPGNYTNSSTRPNNSVELSTNTDFNLIGDFHYSAWVNLDRATASYIDTGGELLQTVYGRQDNSNPRQIHFIGLLHNDNNPFYRASLRVNNNFTVFNVGSSSSTPYQSGWTKLDFWRNGSNIVLAVNAVVGATTSASAGDSTVTVSGGVPLGIGYRRMSSNQYLQPVSNGFIDEFRVRTGTFPTPAFIKTEYNNQSSPSTFYSIGSQQLKP